MKKIVLVLWVSICTLSLTAQGIKFEENQDLNVALAKAKAEDKLVFIDAYAEWCGPCKVMARDIFPQKEVGDYFNAHFVNLKLDMEKGDNVAISKKYEVKAYPTYLFLNGDGELVHKGLGSMPADKFIEIAKVAADSENNFAALTRKIQNGDRSLATSQKYLTQSPYDKGNGALVDSYFQTLNRNDVLTEENWKLFSQFVDDVDSPSYQYFLQNRAIISNLIGKDKVDDKISKTMTVIYNEKPEKAELLKSIDPALFAKAKARVDMMQSYGKFRQTPTDKDLWNQFTTALAVYMADNTSTSEMNNFAKVVADNYKAFNDKKALKNALGWVKKAHEIAPERGYIASTYARLLKESGKTKDAGKMEKLAKELSAKEGSGAMVPMVPMTSK